MENPTSTPQTLLEPSKTITVPKRLWYRFVYVSALAILLLVGGLGLSLQTLRSQDTQIKQLDAQVATLNRQHATIYSEKLPNGKTISYPLNPTNATITWWWDNTAGSVNGNGNVLQLTSTKYMHFFNNLNPDVVKQACGGGGDTSGFNAGASMRYITVDQNDPQHLNVGKAGDLYLHGQAATCMDMIALGDSKDAKSAAIILDEVQSDVKAWAASVTIK